MKHFQLFVIALLMLAWVGAPPATGAETPGSMQAVPDETSASQKLPVGSNAALAKNEKTPPPDHEPLPASDDEAPPRRLDIATLNALSQKSSLLPIFKKGGPVMFPLLLASILALGTVIDRLFFLISVRGRRDKRGMAQFFEAIGKGDIPGAIGISRHSKYYVLRTLGFALEHREKSLANALLFAQEQEMKRFRRGIPILDTVITLAPLLGLLGTVTGMMGSFALIGGELETPGAITGGIAEALIATAFGLGIAITSLIPFNYLNNRMEEARMEIEAAATQLELMMEPRPKKAQVKKMVAAPRRAKKLVNPEPMAASANG